MKVHFEKVGYANKNFSRECRGELTYDWLYEQVKPHCMSRNISFSYNKETGVGHIFGGYQTIGGFRTES